MTSNRHRLDASPSHPLDGRAIDRRRPLQFRLDGRVVTGFAGDTVLSAALAAGITTVGTRNGRPLALSLRHAPSIAPAVLAKDPQRALPMERTKATDGADYVTLAHRPKRTALARLLRRGAESLGLDLDRTNALARPWLGMIGEPGPQADLVVVGGGVAGMAAALAGAQHGLRVVLVEAAPQLGGASLLFGRQDGEETPALEIARLSEAVGKSDAITVLVDAEVFAIAGGMVRLHQVQLHDSLPTGRVLDIRAAHIVLATGALERLPVFPGNRLPGITLSLEAFHLAFRYGIWPGRSTLFATVSSPAYRLAMQASDAGISVPRIIDSRPRPQSRFLEFSKAYGITLASGTIVTDVAATAPGLLVSLQLSMDGYHRDEPAMVVDRLVACGGWQPDLTLWHMAGGASAWNAASARLEPLAGPEGVVLAGSSAGWLTRQACLASGADAVRALLDQPRQPVEDRLIDPLYETSDGPSPIGAQPSEDKEPAFLDAGRHYLEWPRHAPSRWPTWWPWQPHPVAWSLANTPQPLAITDIAAAVQLGTIPPSSAGIVAQERVAMIVLDRTPPAAARVPAAPLPPAYLAGRYRGAALWVVAPEDRRLLEPGALIHANADHSDPLAAIGVVLRIIDGTAIAWVRGAAGQAASVIAPDRSIAITLVVPYREGMNLAAAGGSGAGPL